MMRFFLGSVSLVLVLLLAGCDGGISIRPKSGGRPYEVLVTGEDSAAVALLKSIIEKDAVPGLPQSEPKIDVSTVNGEIGQGIKYARNMVVAVIDGNEYTATRVRYERNVFAEPQITIYVGAPSVERLKADLERTGRTVSGLIERFETATAISELKKTSDRKVGKEVAKAFGVDIYIPIGLKPVRRGRHFMWLSDNSATSMRNICIYTYVGTDMSPETVIVKRDSILRVNMPGETDGMYMQTERKAVAQAAGIVENGQVRTVVKGLWQMEGDAMGGPFVAHAVADSVNGRVIVAEGFVYAPGKKKRNIIKQLEAALYTLK